MADVSQFNRTIPALSLAVLTAFLGLHHWYAVSEGRVYMFVVFLVPMLWALAGLAGGLWLARSVYGL